MKTIPLKLLTPLAMTLCRGPTAAQLTPLEELGKALLLDPQPLDTPGTVMRGLPRTGGGLHRSGHGDQRRAGRLLGRGAPAGGPPEAADGRRRR